MRAPDSGPITQAAGLVVCLTDGAAVAVKKGAAVSGPWRVLVGINYPPNETRAEIGDIVNDIPSHEAAWMLEQGIIESPNSTIEESS